MTLTQRWQETLATLPLVAILRGLGPDEALDVGDALISAGFKVVEVPLNSPQPFVSIEKLAAHLGDKAIVGAGTVLKLDDVQKLSDVGGQICISPNTNPEVIRFAKALGLISFPAFFTPTEAFAAIEAGADAIKLFPAELAGPKGLKAMNAVIPRTTPVFPVGGIEPTNMGEYLSVGARGFGIGSSVYKPGDTAEIVYEKAKAFVTAWHGLKG
jgi:2-dehydro-3-deoxyphosphogalactonate aldolase